MLKIKLIKSRIGSQPYQRKVLDALGLKKTNSVKMVKDSASIKGMISKVSHMLEVTE